MQMNKNVKDDTHAQSREYWMVDWWGNRGLNKTLMRLYRCVVLLTSFFGIIILYTIFQPELCALWNWLCQNTTQISMQQKDKDITTRLFSSLSVLPLFLTAALIISPLAWRLRLLRRDQNKVWAMLEDLETKIQLITLYNRIAPVDEQLRRELANRLFEHHTTWHSARIIMDMEKDKTSSSSDVTTTIGEITKTVPRSDK